MEGMIWREVELNSSKQWLEGITGKLFIMRIPKIVE
jgi:hypothetical protein